MSKKIIDRHAEEWEEHLRAYEKSRNQLEADEFLIQKHFGLKEGDILPAEWRDMIDRHRQAWVDEWGVKGRRSEELKARHNAEIKADYRNRFNTVEMPEPKEKTTASETNQRLSLIDYIRYPERSAQWETIIGETQAVQNAYKEWGEPIPHATEQRMARRIVAFRQQWQGYEPELPLNAAKTLSDKECQEPFKSFNELLRHHNIIEAHHGHPDNIPESTRKAMAHEKQEFQQEIAEYKAKQENPPRQEFLTRLQTIREHQLQQKRKPK